MRILGIDPGSRRTGFGIVDHAKGRTAYVTSGCVRSDGDDFARRLKEIFDGIREITRTYRPDAIAIEKVFVKINVDSALKLGQARGAALCAVLMDELPVCEYSPTQIKQAVVGKGNAAKLQVQHMVKVLLCLPGAPQADAADALAVALCHINTSTTLARLSPPASGRPGKKVKVYR
ncbi:MAG: crossover junction endodeoxyribonuclease RuvC [Gammaproteobacteria bacterium RBG_16_57_12]|nr:MAG: crossover junction endodeoxyribonuclease RuvC [Gammaproteobacteria bacterium RBG_16_57_12]